MQGQTVRYDGLRYSFSMSAIRSPCGTSYSRLSPSRASDGLAGVAVTALPRRSYIGSDLGIRLCPTLKGVVVDEPDQMSKLITDRFGTVKDSPSSLSVSDNMVKACNGVHAAGDRGTLLGDVSEGVFGDRPLVRSMMR